MENLINCTFGRLTVLEQFRKNNHSYCKCRCICGTIKDIRQDSLKNGSIQSCGCLHREKVSNVEDLTNQTFNYWTVIKRVPKPETTNNSGAYWLCKCKCGTERVVWGKSLKDGSSKSCGCSKGDKILIDLTGQKFGKLTVIKRDTDKPKGKGIYWLCECECGGTISTLTYNLTSGKTKSCGCLVSYGEMIVEKMLKQYKYDYQRQYCFKDLIDKQPLRFDFAIFHNDKIIALIEIQGIQHYISDVNLYSWNTDEHLKNTQYHDKLKEDYCKNHNLNLIIIKYDEINSLTADKLKEKIYQCQE